MTETPGTTPGTSVSTYTSTVVAPAQIVLGVAAGIAAAVVLVALDSGLWPVAILAFLVATGLAVYLGVLSVEIDTKRITLGQGRGEREPRVLYVNEVKTYGLQTLTWAQCFGIGLESDERTTRLSVRPGPTLELVLYDGEMLRLSVNDGPGAMRALDAARAQGT
jgi:hypothetical protein